MKMRCLSCLIAGLTTCLSAAETIHVPLGGNVASAVYYAEAGDVVQLEAGTYDIGGEIQAFGTSMTLRGAVNEDGQPATQLTNVLIKCDWGGGASSNTTFEHLELVGNATSVMRIVAENPTITNCIFRDCVLAVYISGGYPTFNHCLFTNNNAGSNGGGAAIRAYYANADYISIRDCTFTKNNAGINGPGGSAISSDQAYIRVENTVFEDNTITGNGNVYNYEGGLVVSYCHFKGNTSNCNGGGIYTSRYAFSYVDNTVFEENSSNCYGGAAYSNFGSSSRFISCEFRDNTSLLGGGAVNVHADANSAEISGSYFCENAPNHIRGSWTEKSENKFDKYCGDPCFEDINDDDVVDGADLAYLVAGWGTTGDLVEGIDINLDGIVDGQDLALLLGKWGFCP